jgi:N-acyl-D-aspartate/D-glutamate deacylase
VAVAETTRRSVDEVYYDLYLEDDGRRLVLFCLGGYAYRNSDHIREMLADPTTVLGLADGGAHVALICDASAYTSMLSYWVRDRTRGERLPLPLAVSKMTGAPAHLYGLDDRGVIAPGKKADLNVIDLEHLALRAPEVVHDLPTGASRIVQRADGYVATVVAGEVVARGGEDTGARPGRLIRCRTHR